MAFLALLLPFVALLFEVYVHVPWALRCVEKGGKGWRGVENAGGRWRLEVEVRSGIGDKT